MLKMVTRRWHMLCRWCTSAVVLRFLLPTLIAGCAVAPVPPAEAPAPAPLVAPVIVPIEPVPAPAPVEEAPAPDPAPAATGLQVNDEGLGIHDLKIGSGAVAVAGSAIEVHYVGRLENGDIFDSSRERDQPFTVTLGDGHLIAGWEQGLLGMRVGGVRRLIVPPHLAYGERGAGKIPPHAYLDFEIELLDAR
jgi:hypothetical protein